MLKQYKLTMDTINRLQFRHHNEIFDTREEAIEYIYDKIKEEGEGLASEQNSPYSYSLFAEPTVLRYKNEEEETGCNFKKGPHIMLVIGSETNDTIYHDRNRFCIIDIDKTEDEIKNLEEELAAAVKSLTLAVFDTSTLDLHVEKTDDGTFLSGDVKTAETHVFDGVVKDNNLMVVPMDDEAGPEGLFIYVDLTYDEANETFTFIVTNADGTLKKQSVKLPNNYLVSGEYKKSDESLHLHMKDGTDVVIDCEELIAEWGVEGDASKTPIVLTREEVDYDGTDEHHHVEPWQDVLRADVRVADDRENNILKKTTDGRYLYVDGVASNIVYYWNGDRSNVEEQLNKLNKIKISQNNENIIWDRADGFFASAKLDYITSENKLIFTTSNVNGTPVVKEIPLNTVDIIESITYDPTREVLVIKYKNDKGETKTVYVPISGLIDEWDVLNNAHSVKLVKQRNVSGKDILTADVNISTTIENNILEERGEGNLHALYVKGTADNIKYKDTTVEGALDALAEEDESINEKLDAEIARSTAEDEKIETTIGSGFTTDAHETITYKFEQLTEKVDSEADKLQNEIDRSTEKDDEHDGKISTIETTIGSGFTTDEHETVTYKFEQLQNQVNSEAEKLQNEIDRSTEKDEEHDNRLDEQQAEIEAISADSANSIKDIINNDNSINVDKTDPVKPVISVNLSEHQPYNTIRLEGDGLYNFIDLRYDSDTNKLTFVRSENGSTENVEKEIQLNSVPFDIRYDKDREVLIITYHTSEGDKTVEIDLHDLIHDEWTVQDTETIELNKSLVVSGGPDVLTAKVKICHHEDNAIEEHNDGIYVHSYSGEIADLGSRIDTVSGDVITEKTRAEEEENNLANSIATEKDRAIAAENGLHNEIETERRRAEAADTELYNAIQDERRRAEAADTQLEVLIGDERTRAMSAETELSTRITNVNDSLTNEVTRSTNKDVEHDIAINSLEISAHSLSDRILQESADRDVADASLRELINTEKSDRIAQDTVITERLANEVNRSRAEDDRLNAALQQEINDRTSGDAELEQAIRDATLTFKNTVTAKMNKSAANEVTTDIIVPTDDNIIIVDEGIKAMVKLSYDAATNKLMLEKTTASGHTWDVVPLNAGSIIQGIDYDSHTKELVIKYEKTSEPGVQYETRVNVEDLFNPWMPNNPSEKSAIELGLVYGAGPLGEDLLSGRTLITDDLDNDGVPDKLGTDNIIEIRNNGLYVCGSAMTEAQDVAKCVQNEIKVLEEAVIGHQIGKECGSGYTYEPNTQATYINSATSFNNADFILDQSIKNVEVKVDTVSAKTDCTTGELKAFEKAVLGSTISEECGEGFVYNPNLQTTYINSATSFDNADFILDQNIKRIDETIIDIEEDVECVDNKSNKIYELLYGEGETIANCGEGKVYIPDTTSCVISGATSFMEADKMMAFQICEILEMWVSGETCTTKSDWIDDGANKKMMVDVKLSRGNDGTMTDDEIVIENLSGDYIDPTRTEFTDTNALRIVCLTDGGSVTPSIDTPQNGVYLSNVWDCGLYYDEVEDADAIEAAQEAGYRTDPYRTDTSSEASNYNYMNNVRQSDIPHE